MTLPENLQQLLARPNPAVIATVRPDGQPVSVATWYLLEQDRIIVNMDAGRKRLAYLRQEPRVSLTVLDGEDWYTHVSVTGTVAEIYDDTDMADIDRIATHYTGKPYANRSNGRVTAVIDIKSWHVWPQQ
ncbi:PPOX class F420-dependent oxidoreductase [Dactylosporangium matsuzakiense]|uniref:PPOX class F420-dependent enzyme n=1 Tax=Dactylosporangium matsuzakiense TaxID=53360 RepID=A0A9W6KNC3_9ACTN|nr:PPOX class F420-dependent oxidoreductase [Dactylosporangium matsuzakiense]GLL03380.1 PPOX class F420-dependent enzyme [Dactylosporangium matsuzakiense]